MAKERVLKARLLTTTAAALAVALAGGVALVPPDEASANINHCAESIACSGGGYGALLPSSGGYGGTYVGGGSGGHGGTSISGREDDYNPEIGHDSHDYSPGGTGWGDDRLNYTEPTDGTANVGEDAPSEADTAPDATTSASSGTDTDNDGAPDAIDADDDNDGVLDVSETSPNGGSLEDGPGEDVDTTLDRINGGLECSEGFCWDPATQELQSYPGGYGADGNPILVSDPVIVVGGTTEDVDGNGVPDLTDADDYGNGAPDGVDANPGGTTPPGDTDTGSDGAPEAIDAEDDNGGAPDASSTAPGGGVAGTGSAPSTGSDPNVNRPDASGDDGSRPSSVADPGGGSSAPNNGGTSSPNLLDLGPQLWADNRSSEERERANRIGQQTERECSRLRARYYGLSCPSPLSAMIASGQQVNGPWKWLTETFGGAMQGVYNSRVAPSSPVAPNQPAQHPPRTTVNQPIGGYLGPGRQSRPPGPTVDPRTGSEVGRFIVDPRGNTLIEPRDGETVGHGNGTFSESRYPNGSPYHQQHGPHRSYPTPHGHGFRLGPGPNRRGPSLDPLGNEVDDASGPAHWDINK